MGYLDDVFADVRTDGQTDGLTELNVRTYTHADPAACCTSILLDGMQLGRPGLNKKEDRVKM